MSGWTSEQLDRIGDAEELLISSSRPDGGLRKPVPIWVVRHGDDLFVRSYKGPQSGWYSGTQLRHEGHISAGGLDTDATFTDVPGDDAVQDQLDLAYRTKYRRYGPSYVDAIVAARARATTLRLDPPLPRGQ